MANLEEMSLEELWQLFPIVLSPHNPDWKKWADTEIRKLRDILTSFSPIINHIGSTAIPRIQAKPIVDILVELPNYYDFAMIRNVLVDSGYICMLQTQRRMSFNKGYTPEGYAERVFHIHIHRIDDNDEICFRDYLIKHFEAAKEYEALKLSLLPRYRNNRDAYTNAKTEFVKRIVNKCRAEK